MNNIKLWWYKLLKIKYRINYYYLGETKEMVKTVIQLNPEEIEYINVQVFVWMKVGKKVKHTKTRQLVYQVRNHKTCQKTVDYSTHSEHFYEITLVGE